MGVFKDILEKQKAATGILTQSTTANTLEALRPILTDVIKVLFNENAATELAKMKLKQQNK